MSKRRGFTLIEMTIVLFIISLLVLIILPNLNGQRHRARGIHQAAMTTVVRGQATAYLDDHESAESVTYQDLLRGHYLTEQQVDQAKSEHISLKAIVDESA
ncbi:MAG TPA: prepilin-type N-terminal cleavage/methylation domain-containing protein [Candidatus Levilactobacillus faecigallinarum]|uniref:Prepilin-type N-terminal cleavage/methylation domain-containing protein n=1 Tax=Candidatus Levilactobacillus faecigallinarum TaxID=2838638 RepID=A0A9D1QR67_9LACO|nr:prepilin-type N-terminal cleavage/methylation domain-containing protein [Candidatus Levilactobacillus faecigallinarum]